MRPDRGGRDGFGGAVPGVEPVHRPSPEERGCERDVDIYEPNANGKVVQRIPGHAKLHVTKGLRLKPSIRQFRWQRSIHRRLWTIP